MEKIFNRSRVQNSQGKGNRASFTGKYDGHFEEGVYECAGCGSRLFESETKYRSGCGWPAFYEAIPGAIEEHEDNTLGMSRIEITCRNVMDIWVMCSMMVLGLQV